ncbi:MAG: molybdopterin-dependent oxidoreductase, partial [Stellaceae bacterium]
VILPGSRNGPARAMRATRFAVTLVACAALAWATPAFAQTTAALSISGLVKAPHGFTLAELQKMPWTTVEASFQTEHGPHHGIWLGVSLWTLLDQSGGLDASMKDSVRHWLVVTGRDGYAVALSVGEIDPAFGHAAAVVAWSQDGKPFDPAQGLRLILPGDRKGGRDVRDVVSIEVK